MYIVYELSASSSNDDDTTLKNCLFGAVNLTKYSVSILLMELDLIEDQAIHFQPVDMVRMY